MNSTFSRAGLAVVIGAANIDIGARAFAPLKPGDSNPGKAQVATGGVGRNIAHNLRLLGCPAMLLTALGEDDAAGILEDDCRSAGIDLSRAKRVPGASTSRYIYLCGPDGDMELAVSDMEICREISPSYLMAQQDVLSSAAAVVVDANLPEESLLWLGRHCPAPLLADPVSAAKAPRMKALLPYLHTLKPNRLEAEVLTGVAIHDLSDAGKAARLLLDAGVKEVFLSLGADGVLAAGKDCCHHIPCFPARVQNATGAGDAFLAALCRAFLDGMDLAQSACFASAAAAITVESKNTISPELSADNIRRRIREASGSCKALFH